MQTKCSTLFPSEQKNPASSSLLNSPSSANLRMLVFRRFSTLRSHVNALHVMHRGFSSRTPRTEDNESVHSVGNYSDRIHLSPLCKEGSGHNLDSLRIEVVDDDSWHVSAGLAEVWRGHEKRSERKDSCGEDGDGVADYVPPDKEDPDSDDIEDMRIRGVLFYKIDKDSKEYEEYNVDFPRKKSPRNKADQKEKLKDSKKKDKVKVAKKERMNVDRGLEGFEDTKVPIPSFRELGGDSEGKRLRNPTFNQLTGPYHEPFCLDIYVSKGSVRASVIHRATSKVVAVAHSISKDMKFDLGSTKSKSTCVAVGEVLAQRALADDIHNVIYTPRKGDRLEGKLQIVLDSIIYHGVSVKVKLKQRKARTGGLLEAKSHKHGL